MGARAVRRYRQLSSLSLWVSIVLVVAVSAVSPALAQEGSGNRTPVIGLSDAAAVSVPAAVIVNDEGGPVVVTGSCAYTNPFFTEGVAEPLIILEDQAGFVDRDRGFVMAPESQVLGQITSDFYTSPFTYNLALPIEPQGSFRDVDHDGETDAGVQVFAVAYWNNKWGDPFLEERDLQGGGWSPAYASTRASEEASTLYEIIGGKLIVYAPDDRQGFPSGFGPDSLLFTADDPIVRLPQGYTVVDLDTDPFTFDRSRRAVMDLHEPDSTALDDFSNLSYAEAFDAMVEKLSKEYAFTELKGIDWDALAAEFRPRFEEAERSRDSLAYRRALRDFTWRIPDGHVSGPFVFEDFQRAVAGGLGMLIRELDDGRVLVTYLSEDGPAARAGIELRAEIVELNGQPISEAVADVVPWTSPFSTEHNLRLNQLRDVIRFPVGAKVEISYKNPGDRVPTAATLTTVPDADSWSAWFDSFGSGQTGVELPVEYELLDNGYLLAWIHSFLDNDLLTIQLWERMIRTLNADDIPGLIIDIRNNGGGFGFLADQMAAYFFDEPLVLGNRGIFNEEIDDFYFDPNPRAQERFIPPPENLRYHGPVAVLIGPNCASACERFAYDMTLNDRAATVGHYPTAGLGGGVQDFLMPEDETIRFTFARSVNAAGEIHIEGQGVAPTVRVPVNEDTLFSEGDPVLEAAVAYLDGRTTARVIMGGEIGVGDTVTGALEPGVRVRYVLTLDAGDAFSIYLGDDTGTLDTVLRAYTLDGELIGENDDASAQTLGSAFEDLTVDAAVTVILEVATFNDAGAGAYTLEVVDLNTGR